MPKSPRKTVSLRQLQQELTDDTAEVPALGASSVATTPAPVAYLVCISPTGPALGRRYPIGMQPVILGREVSCAIAIPDGAVSRIHAKIELRDDGSYTIEDLNSTNGTFVNDARITAGVLNDGDYLRVGQCIYRFLTGGNIETSYHEEIHRLAILDPLTGIHNHRYLVEVLEREVERARRHHRPLSVVLLDVDHFKLVNDQHGHLAGDFTLKELAGRLKQLCRKDELLARYGGEEFALVLPETDLDGAAQCGERLRRAIADWPFVYESRPIPVTVSVGAATIPVGTRIIASDLLREADERLYAAKRNGRNQVVPAPSSNPAEPVVFVAGATREVAP